MAIFEIEAGGKTFEVEAPDQATALAAIGQMQASPPPGYGGADVDKSDPLPKWDIPGDISRAFQGSVDALKSDATKAFTSGHQGPTGEGMMGVLKRTGQDLMALPERFVAGAKVPLDALGAATSPITGTLNATLGSAMSYLPGMDKGKADEAVGLAMSAARPGAPRAPRAAPPTVPELRQAADTAYNAGRASGLEVDPRSPAGLADVIRQNLEAQGRNEDVAPRTLRALDRLRTPVGPNSTINDIDGVRRVLNNLAQDTVVSNRTESAAANQAVRAIDRYLENIPAYHVRAGDATRTAELFREGRGNTAAARRSERITDALESADLRAASANSGMNIDNATRQRVRAILDNPRSRRGYSEEELAQMERVVRGSMTGNTMRVGGNLLGGGGGLGAAVVGGGGALATANPLLLGLPLAGAGMRLAGAASTRRQARLLDEMVRNRSPVGRSRQLPAVAPNPTAGGLLSGGAFGGQVPDMRYMGLLGEMGLLPYPAQ